jgi:formamidopyrimidine-DNA glycosylase
MPEGPEVEIITFQLNQLLAKQSLIKINVFGNKALQKSVKNIISKLKFPIKLISIRKKGKFIYFWFKYDKSYPSNHIVIPAHCDGAKDDIFIGNNLGLSGHYSLEHSDKAIIEFKFSSDTIYYKDNRHFGKFKLFTLDELNIKLDTIGPDILDPNPRPYKKNLIAKDKATESKFITAIKNHPNLQIAQALSDQKIVSGIGNYLKTETLYASKIYPGTLIKNISDNRLGNIFITAKNIAIDSFNVGGVSIRDYKDIYDELGQYKTKIYGRKTDSKGNMIISKEFNDKRTTYYVPSIQK